LDRVKHHHLNEFRDSDIEGFDKDPYSVKMAEQLRDVTRQTAQQRSQISNSKRINDNPNPVNASYPADHARSLAISSQNSQVI
jgi:hypothetical protein